VLEQVYDGFMPVTGTLPNGMPVMEATQRRLQSQVADVCGHLNVLHEQMVGLTRELVESGAWEDTGCRSPEHWLAWQTGLSPERARQMVMLARRQAELPVSFGAFASGLLSVDQIAVVARRVPAHNDAEACVFAQAATVSQLRVGLSKHFLTFPDEPTGNNDAPAPKPAPEPQHRLSTGFDDDGNWFIRGLADGVDGAVIQRALEEAKDMLFRAGNTNATWLEALIEVCRRSLDTVGSVSRREVFKIIVHLDQQGSWVHHGPPLPNGLLEQVTCDGTIQPLWTSAGLPINIGRAQHIVPLRTRIVVEDRDRSCRHPACTVTTNLQVHHLVHWINGGRTDTCNLVCLCRAHHRAHHRGVFTIDGDADQPDGLTFSDRSGQVIAGWGTPNRPVVDHPHNRPTRTSTPPVNASNSAGCTSDHHHPPTATRGPAATDRPPTSGSDQARQVIEDRSGDQRAVRHRGEERPAGEHLEATVAESAGHERRHHRRQLVAVATAAHERRHRSHRPTSAVIWVIQIQDEIRRDMLPTVSRQTSSGVSRQTSSTSAGKLRVRLRHREDDVLVEPVAPVVVDRCVLGRLHHPHERGAVGVPDEDGVVPVVRIVVADRDAGDLAGPQDRAAALLEQRDEAARVAQVGLVSGPVTVARLLAIAHEVEHHHRRVVLVGGQRSEVLGRDLDRHRAT
jgi:Domain of unknown function (DUF222)